ncbi:MAG: hypothetical protein AAF685_14110 [Cyanobacteria bacterium P01_C01_bin.89]
MSTSKLQLGPWHRCFKLSLFPASVLLSTFSIPVGGGDGAWAITNNKYQVSNAREAVVIAACNTTGGDRYRYIRGEVSNRTGEKVSNIVVRYQVVEKRRGGSMRVARRSGLRVKESQLESRGVGEFDGNNNQFNIPDGIAEVLSVEWRDANGRAAQYKYPRARRCRFRTFSNYDYYRD